MIYLPCVVRGQLDPVFSFKDEHKSEQDFKIKYTNIKYVTCPDTEMQYQWAIQKVTNEFKKSC